MNASVDFNGKKEFVKMGSYGVGVSRLVGAIIEAKYDDKNEIMKWPISVSPYDCNSAVQTFGCDYSWGDSLIKDLCSKTCGLCPASIKLSIGDYQKESIAYRTESKELFIIDIMIDSDTPIASNSWASPRFRNCLAMRARMDWAATPDVSNL